MVRSRTMVRLAVTGGIGSGKTAFCDALRRRRVPVLSADDLSKEIAYTVPAVRRQIRELLGAAAYAASGRLDRAFVARRVFGHPRLLRKLESVLHPEVLRGVRRWFRLQEKRKKRVAVVEAALVYESGLDALVDFVVVVDAPRAERLRRIQARDGLTQADIKRRMNAQMSDRERRTKADVLVHNAGTEAALARKARFILEVIRRLP